jgi:hypothetical protein
MGAGEWEWRSRASCEAQSGTRKRSPNRLKVVTHTRTAGLWRPAVRSPDFYHRSSLNPASNAGRTGAFATNHPVSYIHFVIRVSFGKSMFFGSSRGV